MSADPDAEAEQAYTPDDEAGHAAVIEEFQEDRRQRQEQLEQSLSVKERLEQEAADQTQTVDVLGIDVEFGRLPSDDELALVSIGQRFQRMGEDELGKETLAEMRDEVARIVADNVHDSMVDPRDDPPRMDDPAWWTSTLGLVDLIMTGSAIAQGNEEVSREAVDEFRDE